MTQAAARPADPVRVRLACDHRVTVPRSEYGDGSVWCSYCADFKVYDRCLTCGSLECQSKDGPTVAHRVDE